VCCALCVACCVLCVVCCVCCVSCVLCVLCVVRCVLCVLCVMCVACCVCCVLCVVCVVCCVCCGLAHSIPVETHRTYGQLCIRWFVCPNTKSQQLIVTFVVSLTPRTASSALNGRMPKTYPSTKPWILARFFYARSILGPCWGHVGAMLGPCWRYFGSRPYP